MIQVSVEDVEIAPGHIFEWRMVSSAMVASAGSDRPGGATTFNQAKHFSVAQDAHAANDTVCAYIAGTFDLPGPVDREALGSALLYFVRRHDVLRSTFQQLVSTVACDVLGPEDIELKEVDLGPAGSSAEVRDHLHQVFQEVDPLSWPLIRMGAVIRDDSATVWFACDHLVTDGLSTPIAVHDIAEAYRAFSQGRTPDLAATGSYLAFSREQRRRNASLTADDPRLDYWKEFMAGSGSFFPRFPLDLGLEPGRMYPAVNETTRLLGADETESLEAACRAADGRLFMGLLAAVGVCLRKEGGPDVYRGIMPVSDRGRGPYAHTMGWFINTMPIAFRVGDGQDLHTVMAHVREASTEMQKHLDVPFVKAWELLAPVEYTQFRYWPYAVNFFSYLDFRRSPGAEDHVARNARKHVWLARSNCYSFWLHRTETGLYMNSIYAGTPRSQETTAALQATLRRTLVNMADTGTF
ncbi:condensation domain-containing protein [Streptomyces sp. NPDC002073]|uniref:condensation domain-containing protein n=1 Tax=Streptomyces sp. NBC_00239 TaxID=2903640 RepID=UPI002E2CED92|nr:condensation domain-containing protein [Streptomyces sp. NBC_00239]